MRGEWSDLFKNEIDPRRLYLKKYLRYNIHQNEFKEWAIKPFNSYNKIFDRAEELGHSNENNLFCDDFK